MTVNKLERLIFEQESEDKPGDNIDKRGPSIRVSSGWKRGLRGLHNIQIKNNTTDRIT